MRETAPFTVYQADQIWDGVKIIQQGAVVVRNGKIRAAGKVKDILPEGKYHLMRWKGATLMPGLIDCHSHLAMDPELENYLERVRDPLPEQTLRAVVMMRKDLYAGVTTVRSCGDREFLDVACKKAVDENLVEGPHLRVATRGIRAPDGHGFVGYPVKGKEALKAFIRENIEKGADFIKFYITGTLKNGKEIGSFYSREEIWLIIDEAHRAGKPVAAHCVGGPGLDWAVEAGIDTIEHAYHITDKQIERLKNSHATVVLTPGPLLTERRVRHLPGNLISGHLQEKQDIVSNMSAVIRAGVDYVVGSDAMHGEIAREIAYLVEMGADPADALRAATMRAADVIGVGDITGSLEKGKLANMIVIKGNPLDEIDALKNIETVIKQGVLVWDKQKDREDN